MFLMLWLQYTIGRASCLHMLADRARHKRSLVSIGHPTVNKFAPHRPSSLPYCCAHAPMNESESPGLPALRVISGHGPVITASLPLPAVQRTGTSAVSHRLITAVQMCTSPAHEGDPLHLCNVGTMRHWWAGSLLAGPTIYCPALGCKGLSAACQSRSIGLDGLLDIGR